MGLHWIINICYSAIHTHNSRVHNGAVLTLNNNTEIWRKQQPLITFAAFSNVSIAWICKKMHTTEPLKAILRFVCSVTCESTFNLLQSDMGRRWSKRKMSNASNVLPQCLGRPRSTKWQSPLLPLTTNFKWISNAEPIGNNYQKIDGMEMIDRSQMSSVFLCL